MGRFLNKGNDGFRAVRNGEFVDKSRLIEIVNATINTERQFTCVSRARRFGKSIGAEMLYAYYDQWCGDRELFAGLQNDLNVVRSKDDVLTLLIHLGYLSYDRDSNTCRIPNREVATEFKNACRKRLS